MQGGEQAGGRLQQAVSAAGALLMQLASFVCKAIESTTDMDKPDDEEEEQQPLGLHPAAVGSLAARVISSAAATLRLPWRFWWQQFCRSGSGRSQGRGRSRMALQCGAPTEQPPLYYQMTKKPLRQHLWQHWKGRGSTGKETGQQAGERDVIVLQYKYSCKRLCGCHCAKHP